MHADGWPEGVSDVSVRCRLVRADGSKWHIKELREVAEGFRVDAVPNGASGPDGGPRSNGDPRPNGDDAPSADGARSRLDDEPLLRGDRIEWVEESGEVLWAMRVPMDAVGESPNPAGEADARGAA